MAQQTTAQRSRQIEPKNPARRNEWEFTGGPEMSIEVRSPNLSASGFEGWYTAYPIDERGNVMPVISEKSTVHGIDSHVLPLSTYRQTYRAKVASPSGRYAWRVRLTDPLNAVADNVLPLFFNVYDGPQ